MLKTLVNSPPQKIVEVAAAVLLRHRISGNALTPATPSSDTEFLLACRPEGKVYAGYWEFPGGKLEAGESVYEALVRELHEEMGITVTTASPWLHKQFVYPHATVHLNFWRVTAWDGQIGITAPLEHSAIDWLPLSNALAAEHHLSPILPANGPILKGLALPKRLLITQAEHVGIAAELHRLKAYLQHQRDSGKDALLQIRDRGLAPSDRKAFAETAYELARAAGMFAVLNVADEADVALAQTLSVDGIHLTSHFLASISEKPDFPWVGASCHCTEEILKAGEMGLDYAVLGPVLRTKTHPESTPLGWKEFASRIADNRLPVFALGGLQHEDLPKAWACGAHGVALMRGW
jgi:8-oxo-dGTP diphosphatase